jgi:hypothetical protein
MDWKRLKAGIYWAPWNEGREEGSTDWFVDMYVKDITKHK